MRPDVLQIRLRESSSSDYYLPTGESGQITTTWHSRPLVCSSRDFSIKVSLQILGQFLNSETTNHSYFSPGRVSERKGLKDLQTEGNSYRMEVNEAAYVVSLLQHN